MNVRFGRGQLEIETVDKPSAQDARNYFFRLIESYKPQVIEDLSKSVYPHFDALLNKKQGEVDSLSKSIEAQFHGASPVFGDQSLRELAIRRLLPDWQALRRVCRRRVAKKERQKKARQRGVVEKRVINSLIPIFADKHIPPDATEDERRLLMCVIRESVESALKSAFPWGDDELLLPALLDWSQRWNLTDDWCLDRAVKALRRWRFEPLERKVLMWTRGVYDFDDTFLQTIYLPDVGIRQRLPPEICHFQFSYEGVVISHSWLLLSQRRKEWEQEVWKLYDAQAEEMASRDKTSPTGIKAKLKAAMAEYANKLEQAMTAKGGIAKTPFRWEETHFKWLVEYQIPERLSAPQISRKYGQSLKTVDDGIKVARERIRLSQPAETLKGRRSGRGGTRRLSAREEANKKARLRRFIEARESVPFSDNRAAVAREIGINENYFRRVWIPYLLELTGCQDYETLIRHKTIAGIKRRYSEILRN